MSLDPHVTARVSPPGLRWVPWLVALPLLLYLALPTRNFYWDGVAFAIDIEKNQPPSALLHPNHLIYTLWGDWLYRLSKACGIHTRALFVLQTVNGVLAGLCVILLFRYLRRLAVEVPLAVSASLLFGFSATWWKFATDANAYVPAVFLLLCASLLIEMKSPWLTVVAAVASASSMLFHQLGILLVPVAAFRITRKHGTRAGAIYSLVALVPVIAAYVIAYRAVARERALGSLLFWVTSHTPDSAFSFHFVTNAALSARGTFRLFFGGKVGDFAGDYVSQAVILLFVAAAAGFLARLWRLVRGTVRMVIPPLHLMAWCGVYVAFLYFWMPQNTFYRLFYLPPVILMTAVMLQAAPGIRTAASLLVLTLWSWNFAFMVYPQSRTAFNVPLRFAMAQNAAWPAGTPVVFHQFHPDLWTISYFNSQVAWIGMDRADTAELDRHLEYAHSQQQPLWLEETADQMAAATLEGRQWLADHARPQEHIHVREARHEFRFYCMR